MAINRDFWEQALTSETRWLCPRCETGQLRQIQKTFAKCETADSCVARQEDEWDPDWIRLRFVTLLKCDNANCAECSTVLGQGAVELWGDANHEESLGERFYPQFVSPSPDLLQIPRDCPRNVAARIRNAFALSWGEYEAATNQIRIALELILSERGIPKYTVTNGKRKLLMLHSRIDKFAAGSDKNKQLSVSMKAVKWLGNAGSHAFDGTNSLKRSDVFDGFDLLEHVVDELYVGNSLRLAKLAKGINKHKGPRRHR